MNRLPATAVLLAAGRGRRLRPLTDEMPKPLLPVDGRPLLDYALVAVRAAGITQAVVVVHHLGDQIERYVGDGSAWRLRAAVCRQPYMGGTAHALQAAAAAFPLLLDRDRPFLLTAADYALAPDALSELVAAHAAGRADMTVSVKRLSPGEIAGRSSAVLNPDGSLAAIVEKPGPEVIRGPLAASLIFILPGAALDYLASVQPSPRGEIEIQSVINCLLAEGYTAGVLEQAAPREWSAATV